MALHHPLGLADGGGAIDGIGLLNDKAFGAFDLLDLAHLLFDGHKAVDDANAANARHRHRHRRLGHGIHVGAEDWGLQGDRRRQTRGRSHIAAGSHRRPFGNEQHIIKR